MESPEAEPSVALAALGPRAEAAASTGTALVVMVAVDDAGPWGAGMGDLRRQRLPVALCVVGAAETNEAAFRRAAAMGAELFPHAAIEVVRGRS